MQEGHPVVNVDLAEKSARVDGMVHVLVSTCSTSPSISDTAVGAGLGALQPCWATAFGALVHSQYDASAQKHCNGSESQTNILSIFI